MPFRRNVFVLGAGFAADAGAPVMHNFLTRAETLLHDPYSGLSAPDREVFARVFEFLRQLRVAQAKIRLDLENIEHLFGLAEMDLEFGGRPPGTFRRDLTFLILRTLERCVQPQRGGWRVVVTEPGGRYQRTVEGHYGHLFAAYASRRWLGGRYTCRDGLAPDTVITMNYDCFVDDALVDVGVAPNYELPDADYPPRWTKLPRQLRLLKLHGSANWMRCHSETCRGRIGIWEGPVEKQLEYFYGRRCDRCSQPVEPVIVPPTWNKLGQPLIFSPVWTQALLALREAERIFIIGYSMPLTDTFFQYLLGLALATNERLHELFVVDPDEHTFEKYVRLFQEHFRERRLKHVPMSSVTFVANSLVGSLGQEQEGLDPKLMETSGFRPR